MLDRARHTKPELRKLLEQELLRLSRTVALALEVLVERYQTMVRSIVGKFRPAPHDFDDYVQVGHIGLLKAIRECDPNRALSSYARTAIYREIRDYKNETKGPAKRPPESDDSFKYRRSRPAQQAMLLASEDNCFSDPLSVNFRSQPDLSFDYEYAGEDDENGDYYDRYVSDAQSFDRRGHEKRINLDHALEALDLRSRHVIEKRWLINECFDGIKTNPKKESYIESGEQERVPTKHEELAAFFGVSRQRIGQLEAAALKKLKAQNSKIELPNFDPHFVTQRWNALSRVPAPRPYLDSCEALGRLVELLLEPPVLRQPRNEQPLVFQGWPWSKPTIVDDASRVKRTQWPYPRPKFSRDRHIRIARATYYRRKSVRRGVTQIIVSKQATDPVSLGLEREERGFQGSALVQEELSTNRSQRLDPDLVSPEQKDRFKKIRVRFEALSDPRMAAAA